MQEQSSIMGRERERESALNIVTGSGSLVLNGLGIQPIIFPADVIVIVTFMDGEVIGHNPTKDLNTSVLGRGEARLPLAW